MSLDPHAPFDLGPEDDDLNDLRADLSEAEDRYQAAEHDLGLLQEIIHQVTTGPLGNVPGIGWVWYHADPDEFGAGVLEVTEEQADAINRALDACS